MTRRLLAVLSVLATTFVLAAHAEDRFPAKVDPRKARDVRRTDDKTDPKILVEDAATEQERLKRQFDEFKQKLLVLAQRMENSTKPEDREKAKTLREAIKKASEEGVETRFSSLIERLRSSDTLKNTESMNDILEENRQLRTVLRDIMELLLKDDRDKQLKEEKERAQRLLDELKNVIRQQEVVIAKTVENKTKGGDVAKSQEKVRERTDNLANPKSNKGNEAKNGEGKSSKSGKEGVGEGKNDTKEAKADNKQAKDGEGKEGKGGEAKEGKGGEGKDDKGGEGKENKGGEGKEGKGGEGKEGKGGEGKEGKPGEGKEGKGGEGKEGKGGEGKEGKGGEGKEGKPGEGKEGKPGSGKPSDKPGEGKNGKPSSGKPGDGKPGDGKPGDGKSGDSKGKGEGKGDSKGSAGKPGQSGQGKPGEGKSGQSGQPGQQGQQGEGKSGGKGGQQQQQPSPEQAQIKKQIQDIEKYQERAEEKLRKDNRKDATEDEDVALDKLNQMKKQLEDLLRQLREEEIERLLARLEARCRRMLVLQIGVRDDSVALDKVIKTNVDGKAKREDQVASNLLSDREEEIIKEARAGLKLLEEEGSAVAFAEVFTQVKGDMELVAERLRKTDTGVVTVTVENQIIETLQEMIEALKKAQADNKNKSKPGQPGQSGQQGDQKLLDLLAELKMIRSMQKRVNSRTELYGKQYAGEQAPLPEKGVSQEDRDKYEQIQKEMKDLSKRQKTIGKVTHDIATGKSEQK